MKNTLGMNFLYELCNYSGEKAYIACSVAGHLPCRIIFDVPAVTVSLYTTSGTVIVPAARDSIIATVASPQNLMVISVCLQPS